MKLLGHFHETDKGSFENIIKKNMYSKYFSVENQLSSSRTNPEGHTADK